jgi:nitroreductase
MDFQDVMRSRRAVNFFDPDRDVPEEQLQGLLETAARAPSGFNLQPWKVALLRDGGQKAKLRALAWNQPKVTEAPVVLMFLADTEAWKDDAPGFHRQFDYMVSIGRFAADQQDSFAQTARGIYGQTPAQALAFAVKNTAFFAMTFMYAAAAAGLVTHPMDGFDHDGVRAAFAIPERYWIPLLLAVGHLKPGVTVSPPKWRFAPEEFLYNLPL